MKVQTNVKRFSKCEIFQVNKFKKEFQEELANQADLDTCSEGESRDGGSGTLSSNI